MNLYRPKNLGKTIEVKASNRPIKIAYLVPFEESKVNHMIIDAVFYESYTRWAGAYTLVIPSKSTEFLDPAYESWLEYFDPDFVCTYIDLEEGLINKIDLLCSPIEFIKNKPAKSDPSETSWKSFVQHWDYHFTPVSSRTTIPGFYEPSPFEIMEEPKNENTIITQHDDEPSLLTYNFGTAFDVHLATNPVPGYYRTLCLTPPTLPENMVVGSERCSSFTGILSAISSRKAQPISNFAKKHSKAIPKVNSYKWENSFNLFIGTSVRDKIHFWNVRHFIPDHIQLGALIISLDLFEDSDFVRELGQFLDRNNFMGNRNGPSMVSIQSYSHKENKLNSIRDKLQKHSSNNIISIKKQIDEPVTPEPKIPEIGYHYNESTDMSVLKLTDDINNLTAKEPAHFYYLPPRFKDKFMGQWIVELKIQRHNNLSKYDNVVDNWNLPRRHEIVKAFTQKLGKVTYSNNLALLPTNPQKSKSTCSYDLYLPNDETFFKRLVLGPSRYLEGDLRLSIEKDFYQDLSISDKGQNLRGIISMFDSLSTSYEVLTNKYWRDVLRNGKKGSTKPLIFTRKKLEGLLPKDTPTKKKIKIQLGLSDIGKVVKYMKDELASTLEFLIRSNVFHQIHQWRCTFCGHTNSRNFNNMKIKNNCEICDKEYLAPLDTEWRYQLNDFVHRSLVEHTGLPVLWALGNLHGTFMANSFWYLPEVDLYKDYDNPNKKNEIDILCVLDGKFYAVEVKLSVHGFIDKEKEIENFVNKINYIHPDIAMLVFEHYCENEEDIEKMKEGLLEVKAKIGERISSHINLKTVVAYDLEGFNDYPVDLGFSVSRTNG